MPQDSEHERYARIERAPETEDEFDRQYESSRWWFDSGQILVRLILNVLAGGLITLGIGDEKIWEKVTAAAVIIFTMSWAVLHRKRKQKRCSIIMVRQQTQAEANAVKAATVEPTTKPTEKTTERKGPDENEISPQI